jgi:hypothetical protein
MAIPRIAVGSVPGNETAPSSFGHFCGEVPKSLHIGAYPHALRGICSVSSIVKALQIAPIQPGSSPMTCLIAMQKVEGSNPFSRFERDLALGPGPRRRYDSWATR